LIGIVLQARMGSSRLPGKVMKLLCGRPMLGHILDRLRRVTNADVLVVATSDKPGDDVIEAFVLSENVFCFRGDEADVLDRYYRAALHFGLQTIIRATADNPLVDPEEVERLIDLHKRSRADYTHAFTKLPIGVGVECFSFDALERSWKEGKAPNHREHVNEYIQEHPEMYHIEELMVPQEKIAAQLRLTVDTQEDFERVTKIYDALFQPGAYITTEDAIYLCNSSLQ